MAIAIMVMTGVRSLVFGESAAPELRAGIEMIRNINAVELPMQAHNFPRRAGCSSSRTSVSQRRCRCRGAPFRS